jgi:hypothetical protein
MPHTTKQFHLGDILSVTHDRLVSLDHMGGVYKIMGHLFQQPVYTHQLVILHDEAKRELFRQLPWLNSPLITAAYDTLDGYIQKDGAEVGVTLWLAGVCKIAQSLTGVLTPHFEISPIMDAEQRDPISDLEGLVGKDKIIVVKP